MSGSGGWSNDPTELVVDQFMLWSTSQPSGQPLNAWTFQEHLPGYLQERVDDAISRLVTSGLAQRLERSLSGKDKDLLMTDAGKAEESRRAAVRSNPRRRNIACREALLDWLYGAEHMPVTKDFVGDVRAHFHGDPLSELEVSAAARYLKDDGRIKGIETAQSDGPIRIEINSRGREIVERHDGRLFKASEPQSVHYGNTFHAPVGQVAQGWNFTQVQNVGLDPAELARAIAAVREAIAGLQTDEREAANRALDGIEDEVKEGLPDTGPVRRRLKILERITEAASVEGMKAAVGFLTQVLAGALSG